MERYGADKATLAFTGEGRRVALLKQQGLRRFVEATEGHLSGGETIVAV
jgi:hypothetical protein